MTKQIKNIVLSIFIVVLILCIYLFYNADHFDGILANKYVVGSFAIVLVALFLYLGSYFSNREKVRELRYRDKLFGSLVNNSDTIYFMYNKTNHHVIYMTKNIEEVLGIKDIDTEEKAMALIDDIFENPILKEEMRKWDGKDEFVSSMVLYRYKNNPNITRWIKIKRYTFIEKKDHYEVVLVSNVTKEYERQHLLVIQASDIKLREKQLNDITSASYDIEINLNLTTGGFTLKNLKENINYLGPNIDGNYERELPSIVKQYIYEEDQKEILEKASLKHLKELTSKKIVEPLSLRYRLANQKETLWLESTLFFTTNRGEAQVTILTKNVTENAEYMRKQNVMLQNALTEAKKANEAKSQFLKTISHEIRTPMNAIIGLSESALAKDLPRDTREDIESINSASNHILEIIDGLLDIPKVESGVYEKKEREYDVPKFLKDLVALAKEYIGNKDIKLKLNVAKDLPTKLFGDSAKIHQILLNILSNAVKYTEKGTITIEAKGEKKGSNLNLTVAIKDTGRGIEREQLAKLFADNDADSTNNTGLYIAKKLIDLLNGTIVAESEYGQGSTFTVSLNQKIIDDTNIGDIENYVVPKKRIASFNALGKKILVVDDDKLNLKVANRLLEHYELDVETTDSGKGCLKLIEDGKKYDLILLDQMMKGMDGVETLQELKKIKGFDTPVVVLTADAVVGAKEDYLKKGFDDYLSKPIDTKELNSILNKYLKKEK